MPLNFPSNPTVNDQYIYGGRTWVWNGSAWDSYNPGITAYVSALNGYTGGVTLAAGSGITLTGSANVITIATTGGAGGVGATGPTGPQGNTGATGPVGDYVISFNGLTGAVTGVTTSTTNTFTALQTFSNGLVATGATLSGTVAITGLSIPTADADAANKAYVDDVASVGVHYHTAVVLASTDVETFASGVTYSNGTLGVGATLTKTAPFARLNIDSTDGVTADRILVRSATTQQWNGVYDVTDQGSASNAWILTRSADANNYHPYFNDGLGANDYFFVTSGASLKNNAYICNVQDGITFGTTAITFALFSTPPVYTAGTGLALNSLQFSNTGVLTFNGSTGAVTGVASFNGSAGAVTGVTAVNAGSGISISGTTNPTISNSGVTGFNQSTGNVIQYGFQSLKSETRSGITAQSDFTVFNDFIVNNFSSSIPNGTFLGINANGGSFTISTVSTTSYGFDKCNGVVNFITGTTNNTTGYAGCLLQASFIPGIPTPSAGYVTKYEHECRFMTDTDVTTENTKTRIGFADTWTNTIAGDGVYFEREYNSSTPNLETTFKVVFRNGGAEERIDTGVTFAVSTIYRTYLCVERDTTGTVTTTWEILNDTTSTNYTGTASPTTTARLPLASTDYINPGVLIQKTGAVTTANSRLIRVDYIGVRIRRPLNRSTKLFG